MSKTDDWAAGAGDKGEQIIYLGLLNEERRRLDVGCE